MATLFDYEEDGSPWERREGLTLTARRQFIVPWAERYQWRGKLLDWYPDPTWCIYPYAPAFNLLCQSVEIQPFGKKTVSGSGSLGSGDAARISYEYARLIAEYPRPDLGGLNQNPDNAAELISEEYETTVEFLTLPPASFLWKTPTIVTTETNSTLMQRPVDANGSPGILVHGGSYTYTRHNAPWVPQSFFDLKGSINSTQIQSKLLTTSSTPGAGRIVFPALTLLYQGLKLARSFTSAGVPQFALTLKFIHRDIPSWNKFWRAELYDGVYGHASNSYDEIVEVNGGQTVKPYRVQDLSVLFNAM